MALRLHYEVAHAALDTAKEVFQEMLDRGMHPTAYHYAALMDGYTNTGDITAAYTVLQSAVNAGVRPSAAMYTILIAAYARVAEPERATQTFQDMLDSGVQPDIPAVDAVVSAYVAARQYGAARETLLTLWPSVAPPRNNRAGSLKALIKELRSLDTSNNRRKALNKTERRLFKRRLQLIVKDWKRVAVDEERLHTEDLRPYDHVCTTEHRR